MPTIPPRPVPRRVAWLEEACRGRADQVEVFRAFLRAVLCGRTDIQRFPELVGPGGSGKGTFTRLAQGLVGLENVAVTELKYLESNRFETSNLIHKRLIVITDAEQWAGQITTLKALTGGDSIRVERKNVQKHPTAVAEGLVLVSANEAITSGDYTSGLDRRRIPMPFQHKPPTWRNLLEIKGERFVGELAGRISRRGQLGPGDARGRDAALSPPDLDGRAHPRRQSCARPRADQSSRGLGR